LNAAIAAHRLGALVRLVGRVGEDDAAGLLRRQLLDEGVDTRALETVPGTATSVSAIVVDPAGTRQIYNHRGDALALAHGLDTALLEGADVVLVDPRWVGGAAAALEWARRHAVLSVLDADVAPVADLRRLVSLARWAVFSEPGLAVFAPGQAMQQGLGLALQAGCEAAMVTRGERSLLWQRRHGPLLEAAVPRVKATDTTGAGDVFHAALALALAEGMADRAAAAFASAAAALKCKAGQGVFGAPRRAQVEAFLRRWPPHNAGSGPTIPTP
jgi:sulfofructose kinase